MLTVTLTGEQPAELRLTWRTDARARQRLERRLFGKRILFTNRDGWPVAEVVAAYRSQAEADNMKRNRRSGDGNSSCCLAGRV